MSADQSSHVFWIQPMPGVADAQRVVIADNQLSVIVLLPDNSQILITADRVVYLRDGYLLTLAQWQYAPAEYAAPDALPGELEDIEPPFSVSQRPSGGRSPVLRPRSAELAGPSRLGTSWHAGCGIMSPTWADVP
jgi:hypothetical protein